MTTEATVIEPTITQKRRGLPWAIVGNAAIGSAMVLSFFGSLFPVFLERVGLSKSAIGLTMSAFAFSGLLAPLVAPLVARVGFKRCFLAFYGMRKLAVLLLAATPWVVLRYGSDGVFYYVVTVTVAFAVCRAIAETAYFPWNHEYVPPSIRGRYSALENLIGTAVGAAAVAVASLVLGNAPELERFSGLFVVAGIVGAVGVLCYLFVPGGAPARGPTSPRTGLLPLLGALKDRNFRVFHVAIGVVVFTGSAMGAFMPLYLHEQIGLSPGQIVMLQSVVMAAGLVSSFGWGWAIDRYGSRPVMILALWLLTLFPVGLMLLPRSGPWSWPMAVGVMGLGGIVVPGWMLGYGRHLFVRIVPADRKTTYLSASYAWAGVVGGLGPLAAGWMLEWTSRLDLTVQFVHIDPYFPLLLAHLAALMISAGMLHGLQDEEAMPASQLAGMLVQGNPVAAVQSLIAYHIGGTENWRVLTTARLGQARSPLAVEELIRSLEDPSFNVRYEAIISIARTRAHPRLIDALIRLLNGAEPDLAIPAAWALGRLGDRRAAAPLRDALTRGYPLLAARAARALGALGDRQSVALLLARLRDELDDGIRIAYAAALGRLGVDSAATEILHFLRTTVSPPQRRELTLALACIVGDEWFLIRLWRRAQDEPDAACSQATLSLKKPLRKRTVGRTDAPVFDRQHALHLVEQAANAFGRGDLDAGARMLAELIRSGAFPGGAPGQAAILNDCVDVLEHDGAERREYVLLALHALHAAMGPSKPARRGRPIDHGPD